MQRDRIIELLGVEKPLTRSENEIAATADHATLLSILSDDELNDARHPTGGYAPTHVARLLGELKVEAAIAPMLEILRRTDWDTIVHDSVIQALPMIGAPVVEPVLAAYAETADDDFRTSLSHVLAECGVRDERIFQLLIEHFEHDLADSGLALGSYGDPRALPHLLRAYDEFEIVENDRDFGNGMLVDLRENIELLGGTLTIEQEAKFEIAMEPIDPGPSQPAVRRERPGRNDPCWCGSDKKYKKCHLEADDLAALG